MPNISTIRIKRSPENDIPTKLEFGEPAFSESSETLFIGKSDKTPLPIAGPGVLAPLVDRADFIQNEVEAVVQTVEVLAARTAVIEAKQHDVLSPTEGQSLFGLTFTPALPHLSLLFVNGVKAHYGTHYRLNGSVLEWLNPVVLQADDRFEIFYF